MNRLIGSLIVFTWLCACTGMPATRDEAPLSLNHGVTSTLKPWTPQPIDREQDKFSFAIFSDLTGGEREGVFEVAVEQLNLLRPDLILNVGDLIEGSDDPDEMNRQWDSFDERANRARAPVFYVGGNHDLMGQIKQDTWERRYGQRYYHLRYKNTLFLILDTEDHTPERSEEINALRNEALAEVKIHGWGVFADSAYANLPEDIGGNISDTQADYFISVLQENEDVNWTFLLAHKAPWERESPNPFHDMEEALSNRPYTVFHGHQHAYQHQVRHGRDYIQLATTGGVQLPENGRSMDHLLMVTVDTDGATIATLLMDGILDKTGRLPLDGDQLCFESTRCEETP